jgi:hypothetical protein
MGKKPASGPKFEVINKKDDPEANVKWFKDSLGGGKLYFAVVTEKSGAFTVRSNMGIRQSAPLLIHILGDMFGFIEQETDAVVKRLEQQVKKGLK